MLQSVVHLVSQGLDGLSNLSHWQICALATWLLIQGTIFAVAPEEVIFMTLGVLWSQGKVGFAEATVAALAGLVCANNLMVYVTGHFQRNSLIQKPSVQRALDLVRRRGRVVIAITRFTPFIRAPIYASVGLSGMGVPRFFAVDAPMALIHVPALILAGAWIGHRTGSVVGAFKVIAPVSLSVAALVCIWFFAYERKREIPFQAKTES